MFVAIGRPKGVNDLRSQQQEFRSSSRQTVSIAVIDDEEFQYLRILREHGFSIKQFDDIADTKAVEAYPIVLCATNS